MFQSPKTKKVLYVLWSILLACGFYCLFEGLYRVTFLARPMASVHWVVTLVAAMLAVAIGVAMLLSTFLSRHRAWISTTGECFFVLALPLWGLLINQALPDCAPCASVNRALRSPDVAGLYVLYGASLVAYLVARRRPERLRPLAEVLVSSLLLAGIALCTVLCVHFGYAIPYGFLSGPVGLPLIAPPIVGVVFAVALIRRLARRGREAKQEDETRPWPGLACLGFLPLLGAWSVFHRLLFESWPHEAFTKTCDWGLSQLHPPAGDCHYLCTVAANGHRRLVKPERLGVRRGRPILVNRQLAIANAFEDLLHERWPRFSRTSRCYYDKVGLPVSRYIRNKWLADVVYLIMKPFEWLFYLFLVLVDPRNPERRIDSMYRGLAGTEPSVSCRSRLKDGPGKPALSKHRSRPSTP
jgi:hypothetical protein